nr:hypothetical protein [Pyrinomonadaceae bacterium]
VARGQRLCAQPLDQSDKLNRALEGRSKASSNMAPVVFNCATVSTFPEIEVGEVPYALRAICYRPQTQGRRAKRLPLATFCRASGAH